jgi:cytochrome c oxidase subunit II
MKNFFRILPLFLLGVSPAMAADFKNLYWAPPNVTVGGEKIDTILNFIFWLTFVVFILTQVVYITYLVKYRRRPGVKAHYSHGNNFLEIVWTTIPVLIFLGLAIYSNRVWNDLFRDPPPGTLQVNIFSYQFGWEFRYPGADGKLGETDVTLISMDNKFGIRSDDLAAADDFVSTDFVIPAGRPVQVLLNSRDVIHSFYVPSFRLYQDIVPGRTISWVWFEVKEPIDLQLACSQLCGVGHYNMMAPIRVLSQEEYDQWYQEKVEGAATAQASKAADSDRQVTIN